MIRICLLLALFAAAASAQQNLRPPTVHEIDIQLDSSCIRPEWVYLVLNNRVEKAAKLQPDGHWRWSVPAKDAIDLGIPAQAQVGVRFEGGRTRCRHYDDFPANAANVGVATFSFPRCIAGLDVTLKVSFAQRGESPHRINYVREVKPDQGDPLSKPCKEELDFPISEPHPFLGFANDIDKLSIYLYRPRKDPEGKILHLNPLLKNKGPLAKGEEVGPDRVAILWADETVKNRAMLAPNQIDIDVANLDDIHFNSLTLTLKQK